jgi:hypothetical protein
MLAGADETASRYANGAGQPPAWPGDSPPSGAHVWQGLHCDVKDCVENAPQVQPQHTSSVGLGTRGPSKDAVTLGGFQPVFPSPDAARQATYKSLLKIAADLFERKSVWSKTQSSLEQLQVSREPD